MPINTYTVFGRLNSRGRHEYVKVLQLLAPTDNVDKLLRSISARWVKLLRGISAILYSDWPHR